MRTTYKKQYATNTQFPLQRYEFFLISNLFIFCIFVRLNNWTHVRLRLKGILVWPFSLCGFQKRCFIQVVMLISLICFLIVIAGFLFGYFRGLIAQLGSVFGVILGIICCNVFGQTLANRFTDPGDSLETVMIINVMTYVVIFCICYLIGRFGGTAVSLVTHRLYLGTIDRIGGAVFTMLEYTLVFSIFLNIWVGAFPNTDLKTNNQGVKQFVLNFAPTVLGSKTVNDVFHSMNKKAKSMRSSE